MSSICRILLILSVIVWLSTTGISQQQGKKHVSLDMDDLSPLATSMETLNAGASGWATITPENGRFSVSMPGAVTYQQFSSNQPMGLASFHDFTCESSGRKYLLEYTEPINFSADESYAETGFEHIQQSLRARGLDIITQNSIKYGNHPGRELIALGGSEREYVKMYMVGSRFYILEIDDGNDKKQSEDCKKFLNSFKLTEH